MSVCAGCGTDNRKGARFCGVCGTTLVVAPAGKAGTTPPVPPPAPAPDPPTAGPPGRPVWLVPLVLAAAAVVAGGAVGFLVSRSEDGEGGSAEAVAAEVVEPEDEPAGDGSGPATTVPPAPTTAAGATEADGEQTRPARLFSTLAVVRSGPNRGAPELGRLQTENLSLEVVGTHRDGWYRIRAAGLDGWIFGAFVLPPDPGLDVATTSGSSPTLFDRSGAPTGVSYDPPTKVLITGEVGGRWEVVHADGPIYYVDKADVRVVS